MIWSPATVEYFPDATCHGGDEIAAYFEAKFAAVEGFHLDPVAIVAEGDDALVHWRMTGRHVGPLLGVEGTGRQIALDGIDHFVIRDGVVVTNTVVFDQLSVRASGGAATGGPFDAGPRSQGRLQRPHQGPGRSPPTPEAVTASGR